MNSFLDWLTGTFSKLHYTHRKERSQRKHARSGYTKRPLEMRKADNRRRNKAARKARKHSRPRYTRRGK